MKILIVGAGAVGQVYGWHLAQAGHEVHFFVKPQHAAGLMNGLALYRLGFLRSRETNWQGYQVVTELAALSLTTWDQVWLCVASNALRTPLMENILKSIATATVVCLQPGPDDTAQIRQIVANEAQVVQGLITFISYQSPLPARQGPEGMAYFLSPLAPGLFSGASSRAHSVVQTLRKGGMSAKVVESVDKAGGGSEGLLIPLIAALEKNAWNLRSFGQSEAFYLGRSAAAEALTILEKDHGAQITQTRLLLNPLASRALLALAPRVLPLELEPYLEYHFSKVGLQTRQMLESYIAMGQRHGLPVESLKLLRASLP